MTSMHLLPYWCLLLLPAQAGAMKQGRSHMGPDLASDVQEQHALGAGLLSRHVACDLKAVRS